MGKWESVAESLPPMRQVVVTKNYKGEFKIGRRVYWNCGTPKSKGWEWEDMKGSQMGFIDVTHWMSLEEN